MKIFFIAFALMAFPNLDPQLLGTWKYVAYEYENQVQPIPNPALDLRFSFNQNGIANLKWQYEGENTFCERKAVYEIQNDGWLYQKVIWLNPANHFSCSKDADMQMGSESLTRYRFKDSQLRLELELSGKAFIYILDSVQEGKTL